MAAETKTSVATRFSNNAYVSAADFAALIDSYQDASDVLLSIATAALGGSKGMVYVSGSATVTFQSAATQGLRLLNTATTAAAQQQLGGGTVGRTVFEAITTASSQQALGGTTVGRGLWEAATTAAAQAIIGSVSAASQAEMEAATSNSVVATPGNTRNHPGVAKAYAVFDTDASIVSSYNVTNITDVGTGSWRVNFTNPMSSFRFSTHVTINGSAASRLLVERTSAVSVSAVAIKFYQSTDGSPSEAGVVMVNMVVFGDM